ncbi:unnamed protein product [Ilex paraguariensis]|uniref:C2 NT-type domain-containing protein n=1 Tax=Ilex paraguariensis TaxID=185542 RepID=A0ABC8SRA8_9AQUA
MFKLQRQNNKSSKSGERIDFKFSNFQALQVPKGWDKLFVSIISVETGKTIAKSNKALVRNGNCQWTETLSESIWLSHDDSPKELEEYLFKLVITMGSARSGILGEATVNMAQYMNSKASAPVSLPLKKCNYGTTLQVNVFTLLMDAGAIELSLTVANHPPPTTLLLMHLGSGCAQDEGSKDSVPHMDDQNVDNHDLCNKSNGSDNSLARSGGSPSSQDLGSTSHPGKLGSRETSYSAFGSDHSFNSADSSIRRDNILLKKDLNGDIYNMHGRKEAASSGNIFPDGDYFVNDNSTSNHSSFNSRVVGSGDDLQNQETEFGQSSSHVIATSSLTNAGSSKNLLEAAEDTIEELCSEAKMWERNARKLMLDLDILRKEFTDQSKKYANLEMELSAAYMEHEGLKKEVEQAKLMLEETMMKQKAPKDSVYQSEGLICIEKELANEIKYQQESYANMALQLKSSQESNIELVSVLQELEDTIEKQKVEIENLSELQRRFNDMEKSIQENSEENRNLVVQLQQLQESEKTLQVNVQLLEQSLNEKNNELEKERNSYRQTLLDTEKEYKCKLSVKEEEIASIQTKLLESCERKHSEEAVSTQKIDVDPVQSIETLKEKVEELERDCSELTDENLKLLFKLKELNNNCGPRCASFNSSSELPAKYFATSDSEVSKFESQIYHLEEELKKKVVEEEQASKLLPELCKQLEMALHHIKKPWHNVSYDVNDVCKSCIDYFLNESKTDSIASKGWAEYSTNCFSELNKLLEARIAQCEEVLKRGAIEIKEKNITAAEAQTKLEDYILKFQELETTKRGLGEEMAEKISMVEKLETDLLSKEQENDFIRQCQRELEAQVSALQKENDKLEDNIETVLRESKITSKCLDALRNDLVVLSSSVDSHVSANNILESKLSELECQKHELELNVLKLQEENKQLSECISGLETQLRYMSDEREYSRSELENSQANVSRLQDEIGRLAIDLETQKGDLKQKLQHVQSQLSESEWEGKTLKMENEKLQASSESLIEEYKVLKDSNGELRRQKVELQGHCKQLEVELKESQESLSDYSERIEAFEKNLTSLLEDFSLKEKALTSELDGLLQENKEHKEKHVLQESLLNQMCLEKTSEVEILQRKVEHLAKQISAAHDERERVASEVVHELSGLRADKAKLESALQEAQSKVESAELELDTFRTDSEFQVQSLMAEIAASKQLMADHAKILKLLAKYRSCEETLKTAVNDLELKLTVSEYERQQLIKETFSLKAQLQKIAPLQDEVSALKSKLNDFKFEKEKLEASLHSISKDCEELEAEKILFVDKILNLQKDMSEFEDCKYKKVVLEEKLRQMEGDLEAKEALYAQEAELRNEHQLKIQLLEEEKEEYLRRAQVLEEDLKLMEEKRQDRNESFSKRNGIQKSNNQQFDSRKRTAAKTSQSRKLLTDRQNSQRSQCQTEGGNEHEFYDGSPHAEVDHMAKIQLLENELAEATEANNKFKTQLQRLSSEGRNIHTAALRKSMAEGEVVAKERYERTKSSLETELKDIRERYFEMSLKYAEVEAQREDLVMKLKSASNGKRWFL